MSKQYLFVANRDVTVVSLKGYALNFKKGVPQHVPLALHAEVVEKGILPYTQEGSVDPTAIDEILEKADAKPKVLLAPETQDERDEKIREALKAIGNRNNARDFTAGGVPSAEAVTAALGWKVDAREIKPLWNKFRQELNEGK